MSNLTIRYNDHNDTLEIHFIGSIEFREYLSSLSSDMRTWNSDQKCWVVLPDILVQVVTFSKPLFDKIYYSSVPINYQKIINNALNGVTEDCKPGVNGKSNYSKLFLVESSPQFIVKAVHKILAKRYHPDGDDPDEEKFLEIQKAYDEIKSKHPNA